MTTPAPLSPAAGTRPRSLVGLTIATAIGVAILIGLGVWQVERRTWKLGLIERIAERVTAPPVDLSTALAADAATGDVEYLRVTVQGRYLPGQERWLYAPTEQGPGYDVFAPLVTDDDHRLVLVNRGFLPQDMSSDTRRPPNTPQGPVTVVGLIRKQGAKSWFALPPDTAKAEYYWPDYTGMLASLPADAKAGRTMVPFVIDAQSETGRQGVWPKPGTTVLEISNRHLEYALTWFGLAATLVGVYLSVVLSRR